jgi:hypothetical protein
MATGICGLSLTNTILSKQKGWGGGIFFFPPNRNDVTPASHCYCEFQQSVRWSVGSHNSIAAGDYRGEAGEGLPHGDDVGSGR